MVNQKQGVYDAVVAFCEENNIHFEDGMKCSFSKEGRAAIVGMVAAAMTAGEVQLSAEARAKHDTPQKIKTYCSGLVNNWLRKDTRLNGGDTYQIKNPGSRAGSGDEVLKNLKALQATLEGENKALVDAEIAKRVEELKQSKLSKIEINFDVIPDSLKEALGLINDEPIADCEVAEANAAADEG